jgi:Tol biopolymer transport system component
MVDLTTWTETYVGSNCGGIRLSDDGSVVAYYIPSALGGQIYGGPIGGLDLVSKTPGGAPGNGWSYNPVISPDGRYIGFVSQASDLIADDTNTCLNYPASGQCPDVFVHDLQTSETTRVSVGAGGEQADGASSVRIAALSNAAREVVFRSNATNLVPGDTNNLSDIFIRTNALGG